MSSAFQVYGLLMDKAVVTLLIRSFRGGQTTIAHYLYALSYYIIEVTGGGCFERTYTVNHEYRASFLAP